MKKPLIGIVPLIDKGRESYWMLPGYMKGIEEAGGLPIMLPLTSDEAALKQLSDVCDGFLFTGGQDVSPSLYQEEISEKCGEFCPKRDEMEPLLLRLALQKDKAILGICRGIQLLNVALGGTLYQDLPTDHPSEVPHHQDPPYHKPSHTVRLLLDSPLYELLKKETLPVNSCHHQAIKNPAPGLCPMACSDDGIIEAVCLPTARFVWAVQWHPEFSHFADEDSRKIFRQFVRMSGRP